MSKELSLGVTTICQVQDFVNQIRVHNAQIGNLLGEIEQHREAIDHSMKQIESIITPPVSPAIVCDTCRKTLSTNSGGYTVHYRDSDPKNGTVECEDCCPPSPNTLNWIARYEEEAAEDAAWQEEDSYSSDDSVLEDDYDPDYDPNYDHGFNCPCGSFDCRQFQTTTGRNNKVYPEECG